MRALCSAVVATFVGVMDPASAAAEARLQGIGTSDVREVSHAIEVRIERGLADVEHRMAFANPGASDGTALYSFQLPAAAAVYDLSIRAADGVVTRSAVVADDSAIIPILGARTARGEPDRGLLRLVAAEGSDAGALKTYELYASPLSAGQSIEVRLRWRSAMSASGGRHSLRIPHRGDAPNLVREDVTLRVEGPYAAVFGGGKMLGGGGRHEFSAPSSGDLVIEAAALSGTQPAATAAVWPLGADRGVIALQVVAPARPAQKPARPDYLLLIADVSRSLGRAGREAARQVADDMITSAGTEVPVEVITFDRRARRLFDDFRPGDRDARRAIAEVLASSRGDNGSDLRGALEVANQALRGRGGDGLIVVLTDTLLPLSLEADDAIAALAPTPDQRVATVALVPDAAPHPHASGPLLELAAATRGALIALRHRDAVQRGPGLLAEFGAAPPLVHLEATAPGATIFGLELPSRIEAGSGATVFGYYEGKSPRRLTLSGRHGAGEIDLRARMLPRAAARSLAQLAIANAGPGDLGSPDGGADAAEAQLIAAGAALGVVAQGAAIVAVAASDGFARARLDLAARWGPRNYHRFPRPEERGHRFRAFEFDPLERTRRAFLATRTGEIDRDILRRIFVQYVRPRARSCYDKALRGDRTAAGSMTLEVEIARGEVHFAQVEDASVGVKGLVACVVAAAYAMDIPAVAQGGNLEAITLARFPIRFRFRGGVPAVDTGPPRAPGEAPEGDDPLEKLPD